MRRKDREIENAEEIFEILQSCDTLSIGFNGKEYPYVVPVSFGAVKNDDCVVIYFHGAGQGQKIDMLESDPRVCVEGHIFYKTEPTPHGITTRYESVIGFGTVEKVGEDEIISGLQSITAHYGYPDYTIDACKSLPVTAVYKIRLSRLTGKRNLPDKSQLEERSAMDYKEKAIACVKNTVLPVQRAQFEECGRSLDEQYKKYGNTDMFFAGIIEPGHVYEVGYPRCVCGEALSGKAVDVSHCECSRNSILYILQQLLPEKDIQVETIHTVLGGADNCRFRVTVI